MRSFVLLLAALLSFPALASDARRVSVGEAVELHTDPGDEVVLEVVAHQGQRLVIRAYGYSGGTNGYRVYDEEADRVALEDESGGMAFTASYNGVYSVEITRQEGSGRIKLVIVDPAPLLDLSVVGTGAIGKNSLDDIELSLSAAVGVGHAGFDLVASGGYDFQAPRFHGIVGLGYRFGYDGFETPFLRLAVGLGYALGQAGAVAVSPLGFGARLDWIPDAEMTNALFNIDTNDAQNTEPFGVVLSLEAQYQTDDFTRISFGLGLGF